MRHIPRVLSISVVNADNTVRFSPGGCVITSWLTR